MRSIALDVHRDFCEVAIKEEGGEVRSAGRVRTSVEQLELFARSLGADDQVALEATGPANAIAALSSRTSPVSSSPTRAGCGRSPRPG